MSTESRTLADEYPREQQRLRELIAKYEEAGKEPRCNASLALAMLRDLQRRAEAAAAAHNTVAMLRCFAEMKEC